MILLRRILVLTQIIVVGFTTQMCLANSDTEVTPTPVTQNTETINKEDLKPNVISKKSSGKIQEVNFEEMGLKGTLRNPEGSYLVQKRGLKFMPLLEVQKNFDEKIRETSDYVKGSL